MHFMAFFKCVSQSAGSKPQLLPTAFNRLKEALEEEVHVRMSCDHDQCQDKMPIRTYI